MTVLVHVNNDREAATAASPRFTGPNWTPTPAPAGTEGWLSFSRWATGAADMTLPAMYAALTAWAGGCAIETGHIGSLADNECEHDRLPTDPTPPCGCWPSEVVKDPPRVVEETTEVAGPKPAIPVPSLVVEAIAELPAPIEEIAELETTKPETPVSEVEPADLVDLLPFVAALVDRLDGELVRLRGERAAVLAFKEALHE